MPNSADLVTDLPADFNVFGQGVDTSMSQLLGGTTGQVLSKTSATNMAFTWVTPTDQTPLTTKGDLFTFTTVDARLGVGTNGQILEADSTTPTGLKWATAASGSTFKGCAIYNSTSPAIANATATVVTFNTEVYDTDAFHSTSTNTSRITIPAGLAGKYQVNATFTFAANSTGFRTFAIYKNGSQYQWAPQTMGDSAMNAGGSTFASIIDCAVTDYLEVFVYQSSGGNLNLNAGAVDSYISVGYLGA